MNFNRLNVITGWIVFAIASIVYLLTIEPTASFWDCGEFIATAKNMEIGHPPGASFWMLISKFFSLFAFGNVMAIAKSINVMSALASGFTILFLFWSITHLAKKVVNKGDDLSKGELFAIMGAGIVGALAYTFSDSFWFSAVEAEVYAMSSLFTAAVFWAILKWESVADEPGSDRWLILIAYLMGISIGVHILNLLAIPAIVLVYYFKKFPVTRKGVIKRTALDAYKNIRKNGIFAINLDEGDELVWVKLTGGDDDLIIATRKGMCIRFSERDARPIGRTARGVRAIRLAEGDEVVGMDVLDDSKKVLTLSETGFGRRSDCSFSRAAHVFLIAHIARDPGQRLAAAPA